MAVSDESERSAHLRAAVRAKAGPSGPRVPRIGDFLTDYYRHVATEDILARDPGRVRAMALSHREFAAKRQDGEILVRVLNPTEAKDGWTSSRSYIQIVLEDVAFLVDSVTSAINGMDIGIRLVVHPQLAVRRSTTGHLEDVIGEAAESPRGYGVFHESWIQLEVDRVSGTTVTEVVKKLRDTLGAVVAAVADWPKMRAQCLTLATQLSASPPPGVDADEATRASEFLEWLAANHFTFLGYRRYDVTKKGRKDFSRPVAGTGLGIMRGDTTRSGGRELTPAAARRARDPHVLVITKANSKSPVHRDVYLDYVSVKIYDARGKVIGEDRFLGLFTHEAYTESIHDIPILKERAADVLERLGFDATGHSGKNVLQILETYPRDELLQASAEHLAHVGVGVLHLPERRTARLFLRQDDFGRFMSCLVYIPRDRYNTGVRLRIQQLLMDAFNGTSIEYTTRVSESSLARLHFVVRVPLGTEIPEVDEAALEKSIVDATRTWAEEFSEAVDAAFPADDEARAAVAAYANALPEAYKEDFSPAEAVVDVARLEELTGDNATVLSLYADPLETADRRRFKLYRRGEVLLTTVMPIFTHMGVEVTDERPYEIEGADGTDLHIFDFGLRAADPVMWAHGETATDIARRFEDAIGAVWNGHAESDGFNALVLSAGLTWREVVIVRAVAKYLRQTRQTFSQSYIEAALVANAPITAKLVELFEVRFDPSRGLSEARRAALTKECVNAIQQDLEGVASLDHDRIIRAMLGVTLALLRTNFYQPDADGNPKSYVSLKLDPTRVPDLPKPRPLFEIWVYSPRVEGVHLRFGKVARGGLRWSDRQEDFRTEVLGLVKAQMVKNAVIVPTGSKGGFFAKQLPDPAVDRQAWLNEGIEAYKIFISGMLDVTDNLVSKEVVHPKDVLRHDGDDTYLVVAADKGTATFSDIANSISTAYGFWLDDAFASGGSAGYDHKGMGITARGAWESVKRHFREMGINTQTTDFTVVGVGDMSGDVFGNGMLLSEHIRLVLAFDHRHVFIDPNPDAATTYAERRRLFDLPRSSWGDYDTKLISEGGGVFPRSAKSIPITPQMITALGLKAGTTALTPAELIHAALKAPVDLLWNGGIGTYVKAATETNDQIGDRANDQIRVDGQQLRCKVVGEGGNLGCSQLGRIEAAQNGIRINTDAIDNSAGVDTSDHEVNIKIALTEQVRSGKLTLPKRNALLASMTDDVAYAVLRDNYEQNVLLGNARVQSGSMLTVHARFMNELEKTGGLDRELEFLPSDAQIQARFKAGEGLTSPEFAVLVAYAKLALKDALLPTALPDDPWFEETLADYFPEKLRKTYRKDLLEHPLRREIITNSVANSLVNRGGITFAFRTMEETGATPEAVARAFIVCREIFGLTSFVDAVEALDNIVSTEAQSGLYLEFRRLLDRAVRWFVTNRSSIDIKREIDRYAAAHRTLSPLIGDILVGAESRRHAARTKSLVAEGIPPELAARTAGLLDSYSVLDLIDVALETGRDLESVARTYFFISERFTIDALLGAVSALPRQSRWDSLARGALRDDLYTVLEAITRSVIDGQDPKSTPEEAVDAWFAANADVMERMKGVLTAVDKLAEPGIAPLSVALRTLRTVTKPAANNRG